jgi:hypothetical protein
MKKVSQILPIWAVVIVGCSAPAGNPHQAVGRPYINPDFISREVLTEIQGINFEDGVNASEAEVLARYYFQNIYGACGMWGPVKDKGNIWYFPCATGVIPGKRPGIFVAKQGVQITCSRGPTVTDATMLAKPFDPIWPRAR